MITARLEEGTSIKTCNECGQETESVNEMLKHLNTHRLEEQIELQNNPMVYERVNKKMK